MECITFLEFREENLTKLSNANQIYFPAIFIQTSIHDSSIPHDPHRKFSEPQRRALFFPPESTAVLYRFTFIWVFRPFWYCFCHRTNAVSKPRPLKSLTKTACLHSSNQKKRLCADGGKTLGLVGKEPLPLSLSHARKVWSAGAGICHALAVRGGYDVSHFRMDSTMCGTPPSFFFFYLSCQMNACSLGYRTKEVIHQK